jgi:hypothetical protein
MNTTGYFYTNLVSLRKDSQELQKCIEDTVQNIVSIDTSCHKPGMLLGKIQSGKTRAFIGVIALAFDNEYDIAIILTKGTIALAQQTYERLKVDFKVFIEDDRLKIFDILQTQENLTPYTLEQKLVFVSKKQVDNLERIMDLLNEIYPDLANKRILIVDDEADYASIGYKKDYQTDTIQLNKIASQIDELRHQVAKSSFLQVTATPYSLYLQPDDTKDEDIDEVFLPKRPAFTSLLPTYQGYVGGDFYFSQIDNLGSISAHLYEEVTMEELEKLKKPDGRSFRLDDVLTTNKIDTLRRGLVNFIVGTCIRRIQQTKSNQRMQKYSFVVHTEYNKASHSWQEELVNSLIEKLTECVKNNPNKLKELIQVSFEDLSRSLKLTSIPIPDIKEIFENVDLALKKGHLMVNKVNSDDDVKKLLNESGQLKMMTPLNVFIGGGILDRGITIDNLIGFYYGRRPGRFQQDTVLQHSRMFGNRKIEDLAVTRFYTPKVIYDVMKSINEFDTALRNTFEKGSQDNGVVFIRKDQNNRIKPCSPNKIMLSTITTLTPLKRLLPWGFQTDFKTKISSALKELDEKISECQPENDPQKPFLIDIHLATWIIDDINKMFIYEEGIEWDTKAFKASMEYLSQNTPNLERKGKIWCFVRRDRNTSRYREQARRFLNTPFTETDNQMANEIAIDTPCLMLLRQNGKEEQDWRGSPFWWPVLVAPANTRTVVFASELIDNSADDNDI